MTERRIDALLEGLVRQFASPYDFLRELVQNGMDAGAGTIDVVLRTHPGDGDDVVFELSVADDGEGMDEAIIDGELTRLFASTKRDDRTMAGGFGIGFVSVFAWDPEVVLLQTGRRGEGWELTFHRDRRFEKQPVDVPLEGTTVRLFRRGRADQREAVAEAVRDSLWRWCRFCPLEVTFDDDADDRPPLLVQDAPVPDDAVVSSVRRQPPDELRVAFAVPPHAALLRRGLVLAEGGPAVLLPRVAARAGSSTAHLRVWADSPRLRTTLARDRVVDDAGRDAVEGEVLELVDELRGRLVGDIETLVAGDGPWTPERHRRLAWMHAHLACERKSLGDGLAARAVLRSAAARPVSPKTLAGWAATGVVAVVPPGEADADDLALQVVARRSGVPAIVGDWEEDREWAAPLLALAGLGGAPLREAVSRIRPETGSDPEAPDALAASVGALLVRAGLRPLTVRTGSLVDADPPPVCGLGPANGEAAVLAPPLSTAALRRLADPVVWIDPRHPLIADARALHPRMPILAVLVVALAVARRFGSDAPEPSVLTDALEDLR